LEDLESVRSGGDPGEAERAMGDLVRSIGRMSCRKRGLEGESGRLIDEMACADSITQEATLSDAKLDDGSDVCKECNSVVVTVVVVRSE
jgi:hypothetical protein